MTGRTAGVVARIKELAPSCSNSHCVLHRQELVAETMARDLTTVLDDGVKIVNVF
jgi:predicted HNH restriction endonuclease